MTTERTLTIRPLPSADAAEPTEGEEPAAPTPDLDPRPTGWDVLTAADVPPTNPVLAQLPPETLTAYLAEAGALCAAHCGVSEVDGERSFARLPLTEAFDTRITKRLRLDAAPAALIALRVDGSDVDPEDIRTGPRGVVHLRRPVGGLIEADYDAGYVTPAQAAVGLFAGAPRVPKLLSRAVLVVAVQLATVADRTEQGVVFRSRSQDDVIAKSVRYAAETVGRVLPLEAESLLCPFMRPRL